LAYQLPTPQICQKHHRFPKFSRIPLALISEPATIFGARWALATGRQTARSTSQHRPDVPVRAGRPGHVVARDQARRPSGARHKECSGAGRQPSRSPLPTDHWKLSTDHCPRGGVEAELNFTRVPFPLPRPVRAMIQRPSAKLFRRVGLVRFVRLFRLVPLFSHSFSNLSQKSTLYSPHPLPTIYHPILNSLCPHHCQQTTGNRESIP
jgi:hypothetical protein